MLMGEREIIFNPRRVKLNSYVWVTDFRVMLFASYEAVTGSEVEITIAGKLGERNSKAVGDALNARYFKVLEARPRRLYWTADLTDVLEAGLGDLRPAP